MARVRNSLMNRRAAFRKPLSPGLTKVYAAVKELIVGNGKGKLLMNRSENASAANGFDLAGLMQICPEAGKKILKCLEPRELVNMRLCCPAFDKFVAENLKILYNSIFQYFRITKEYHQAVEKWVPGGWDVMAKFLCALNERLQTKVYGKYQVPVIHRALLAEHAICNLFVADVRLRPLPMRPSWDILPECVLDAGYEVYNDLLGLGGPDFEMTVQRPSFSNCFMRIQATHMMIGDLDIFDEDHYTENVKNHVAMTREAFEEAVQSKLKNYYTENTWERMQSGLFSSILLLENMSADSDHLMMVVGENKEEGPFLQTSLDEAFGGSEAYMYGTFISEEFHPELRYQFDHGLVSFIIHSFDWLEYQGDGGLQQQHTLLLWCLWCMAHEIEPFNKTALSWSELIDHLFESSNELPAHIAQDETYKSAFMHLLHNVEIAKM